ncbi:MAG TPA: protein translocase SEC61 complex subunit gamma [Methanosarcinales archaeon]|nr:protein translocase SEC61 complex subunit gamma [Methanosarcinales archaeon]
MARNIKDTIFTNTLNFDIINRKLDEYTRVFKMTRKPSKDEFSATAKVAGAGILLIGLIGFIIYFLFTELPKMV